jgi:hypothetical protein
MSKGNTKAQRMTGTLSTESILITVESNWIQTKIVFGLFGLSRLFGFWLNETNQMNQRDQFNQPCRNGLSKGVMDASGDPAVS